MNEMWNQFFSLNYSKPRTLQIQIRQQLIDAITTGLIATSEMLPSSRALSKELNVARNTVIAAYKELEYDSYIVAKNRRGYFVNKKFFESYSSNYQKSPKDDDSPKWVDRLLTTKPSSKTNISKEDWQHSKYPFIVGQLDHSLIPFNEWREVTRLSSTVPEIKKWNIDHVDYDDQSLIKQIQSKVLPKRGIWANQNQILITSGSQNAIYIISSLLVNKETSVGIENPGYPDVRNLLSIKTDKVIPIPVDEEGIIVDKIESHYDLIYTTPSHQYPTGVTMSMNRRLHLLDKAFKNDTVIIEDDYEAEINFLKKTNPSLKSLDKNNNVIYVGSFTKAFAPGLRLGYMVAPEQFIKEARAIRRLMIRHLPANNQRSVAFFIGLGHYHKMFTKIQKTNKERWHIINHRIEQEPLLSCTPTFGGSTFWIKIPEKINARQLCKNLNKVGVVLRCGDASFASSKPQENYIHLGYSAIETNKINSGFDIIISQIKKMID